MTELAERDVYLSAGVHIGMKGKTREMAPFVYRLRPDGLAVMDIEKTDERIKLVSGFLSKYTNIMIASRKQNSFKPVKRFSDVIGARCVVGRFLPGTFTNTKFKGYFEPHVLIVTDPTADRQAMLEAVKKRIPIVALCDTFTDTDYIDIIIPTNNKGKKSLGLIFYLLAREVLKQRGDIKENVEYKEKMEDFEEPEDKADMERPRERPRREGGRGRGPRRER